MLYKCYKCGKEFERSEESIRLRPVILCRSCISKEINTKVDKTAIAAKRKKTCIKKYGVDNPAKLQDVKDKMAKTCEERYGAKSPLCFEENKEAIDFKQRGKNIKKTMELKYGGCTYASPELREKVQKTCIEKYGQATYGGSKDWLKKREETLIRVYGSLDEAYNQIIGKSKETCLKLYGCENPGFLSVYHRQKIKYNNLDFDSKPELEFYKFFEEKNIDIKRSPCCIEYKVNGKIHKYFPDFMVNGKLYEIKGDHLIDEEGYLIDFYGDCHRLIEKTNCMRQNNVIIILSSQLQNFFNSFKIDED